MRRLKILTVILSLVLILIPTSQAFAQTYYYSVDRIIVDIFWESDGTARIEYEITFTNDPSADPIEYVDIGVPTSKYSITGIDAWINGRPITDLEPSPYVVPGVALGLGPNAIKPGETGVVSVSITGVRDVLYVEDQEDYASALFAPTWFDADQVIGDTEILVRFHLPPGVQPDEPRWHESPSGWPQDAPSTSLDEDGRVVYAWYNPDADGSTIYVFGASFPSEYIPAQILITPTPVSVGGTIGNIGDALGGFCCVGGIVLLFIFFIFIGVFSQRRRKLAYLPPKLSIEGHGIKRGLTAVEAAILLETPLDRILTMILFALIKKDAATVVKEDPLEIEETKPRPEGLRVYEADFLDAMAKKKRVERERALQALMVKLVKSVQKKMKGFSLKETRAYYKSIVKKAWHQVETAETPEVKSERYADALEWEMLDDDFDGRTRRTFGTGPVFLPIWWGAYRPSTVRPSAGRVSSTPTRTSVSHSKGGGVSLPSLPGAEFASSIVTGVQTTANGLVRNVVDFTGGVTKTTNPPPPPSTYSGGRSSGGGGCACACACACAGCACACAGGGR
ncbi:MAG: hypothetical protein GTO18_03085 [Anaerolineales bacterium]|nr:hypothetical protein [Anaerolineales bacterium]